MAINKKLIHFKSKEKFNEELANANIKDTSIVFIQDSKEIWTHQQFYATPLTVEEIETIVANSPTTEELLDNIAAETSAREKAIEDITTELTELITLELNRAQSAEETLTTNLSNEITRSTAQDEAHDAAIAKEVSDRETAITTEVNDRNNAIKVETDRAVAAEGTLQSNINTLDNELDTEVSRATNAEQALQTAIDTEVSRAKAAETELDGKITNHTTITDAALALKADKADTYTKAQVDQKVSGSYKVKGSSTFENLPTEGNVVGDVYNITNIFTLDDVEYPVGTNVVYTEEGWDALSGVFDTTKLEGDIQTVADNITKETVRAEAAEAALGTSIQTETSNREAANLTLQSNIDSVNTALSEEVSRAKSAEQLNASDITTLAGRVTTNETKLGVVQGDENTTGSINKALKDAKSYTDSIVEGLDATVSGTDKNITVSVTETDGKLVNVTVEQDDPTVAASGEYMYGQDSSKNPVKVSNSDLASVMAAVIGTANFSKNGLMPSNQYLSKSEVFANEEITSLEQIKDGMTFYFGAGTSVMPSQNGSVLKFSGSNCETYFASNENASNLFQRTIREGNDSGWQRIDNFGYNTLAELASGVAEQMNTSGIFPYAPRGVWNGSVNTIKASGMYTFTNASAQDLPYAQNEISYGSINLMQDAKDTIGGKPVVITITYHYPDVRIYSRIIWQNVKSDWIRLDNFGANTKEELASMMTGLMPFQRVEYIPQIDNAGWYLLGTLPNQCASVFLYADVTFVNTYPALYAVSAYHYGELVGVKCRLVVGETGGDYSPNLKYKLEDGKIKFWARGSAAHSSRLLVLTGAFTYEGLVENPPADAIQPDMDNN